MTTKEKAIELVDKFRGEIATSDFHIPDFISGVPMADGSKEYTDILNKETIELAKQCAIICCDEILESTFNQMEESWDKYWEQVKNEINNL